MSGQALTPQQQYALAVQQNMAARQAIMTYGVKRIQQVYTNAVAPASIPVLNIAPQNVGLIQGFIVEVDGNIANADGALDLTRTEFGVSNVLSNITFADLSNYVRHNTTGWHMSFTNSAKQGWVWGGAYQPNVPEDWTAFNTSFANTNLVVPNWNVRSAPLTIAHGANANVREMYYVPLAYSASDFRGAIYGAVTNATMNLQLTINPNPAVAAGGDGTNAVYKGTASATWSGNVTITVYQVYYDQLPTDTSNGQTTVVLPLMDLNNQYCLQTTSISGLVVNQDFPYSYANFRTFMSTCAVFDNGGTLNAGSDVNYVALTSANNTNLFKYTPQVAALLARQQMMSDPPKGLYYFDHRNAPINTNQFGNLNLNFNCSAVNANAQLLVGVEYFAQQTQVSGAQSLSG